MNGDENELDVFLSCRYITNARPQAITTAVIDIISLIDMLFLLHSIQASDFTGFEFCLVVGNRIASFRMKFQTLSSSVTYLQLWGIFDSCHELYSVLTHTELKHKTRIGLTLRRAKWVKDVPQSHVCVCVALPLRMIRHCGQNCLIGILVQNEMK